MGLILVLYSWIAALPGHNKSGEGSGWPSACLTEAPGLQSIQQEAGIVLFDENIRLEGWLLNL